ncbi:pentatricopeptide repeat-containing protein [Tanacetum coccineum]
MTGITKAPNRKYAKEMAPSGSNALLFDVYYDGIFMFAPLRYENGVVYELRVTKDKKYDYDGLCEFLKEKLEQMFYAMFFKLPECELDVSLKIVECDSDLEAMYEFADAYGTIQMIHENRKKDAGNMSYKELVSWSEEEAQHPKTPPKPRTVSKKVWDSLTPKKNDTGACGSGTNVEFSYKQSNAPDATLDVDEFDYGDTGACGSGTNVEFGYKQSNAPGATLDVDEFDYGDTGAFFDDQTGAPSQADNGKGKMIEEDNIVNKVVDKDKGIVIEENENPSVMDSNSSDSEHGMDQIPDYSMLYIDSESEYLDRSVDYLSEGEDELIQLRKRNSKAKRVPKVGEKFVDAAQFKECNHFGNKIRINLDIKLHEIADMVMKKYKCIVSPCQCRRAKRWALNEGENTMLDHYGYIRFYVCFNGLKEGWKKGCRRVIALDGCFLKKPNVGEILTAIGRDGNNHIFPVAWAVVNVENKDNWSWFLELLGEDLELPTRNRMWQLLGLPCSHAIAVIFKLNRRAEEYVPDCFRKRMFHDAYHQYLTPVGGMSFWPDCSEMSRVLPPKPKKMPGRPRKKRIRASHETKYPNKISRSGVQMTCSNCFQKGHNKSGCKNQTVLLPLKPPAKKGRPRKNPIPSKSVDDQTEPLVPPSVPIPPVKEHLGSSQYEFGGSRSTVNASKTKKRRGRSERILKRNLTKDHPGTGNSKTNPHSLD